MQRGARLANAIHRQQLSRRVMSTNAFPSPPGHNMNLGKRVKIATKGILPPTLKINLKKYYPPPVRQTPVLPQHQEIPSYSQSPMPCTESESLRDDPTENECLGVQADGREEE